MSGLSIYPVSVRRSMKAKGISDLLQGRPEFTLHTPKALIASALWTTGRTCSLNGR